MSAINDALRRASGAGTGAAEPPTLPTGLPPLLAEPSAAFPSLAMNDGSASMLESAPEKKSSLLIVLLIVVLFGAAGGAGFYMWKRSQRAAAADKLPDVRQSAGRAEVQKQPVSSATVSAPPKPIAAAPTAGAPSATQPSGTPIAAVAPVAPVAAVPVAPRPPVQFPQLRLQGIYYRVSSPSVMINNRTLFVNDQVQGVTVAAIDKASVTLVLSGQTNILTLR
ncbi:MAG TPA: hypothetical protein VK530_04820 [Candidatus Acidoferrum sp.]|nr:hypothetical protein [Candidatus Acidoferrum sp.]